MSKFDICGNDTAKLAASYEKATASKSSTALPAKFTITKVNMVEKYAEQEKTKIES